LRLERRGLGSDGALHEELALAAPRAPTPSRSRPQRAASTIGTDGPPRPATLAHGHGWDGPAWRWCVEGPGAGRLGATSAAGPPACPPLLVLRPERGRGRVIQIASSLAGPLPRSRRSRRRVNHPRHRPATGRGRVVCPAAGRHDPGSSGRSTKGWRSPRLHPVPQPTSTTRRVHGRDRPSRRR